MNLRDQIANIIDNSFTSYDLRFDNIFANEPYYLQDLGKYQFIDSVTTNIQLLPYSAVLIDGIYNQLAPLDYNKFYVTLLDKNQVTILDTMPLIYFSEGVNANSKRKFLHLEGIDMQYSYITWSGEPLIATSLPFVVPFIFTYYNGKMNELWLQQVGQ